MSIVNSLKNLLEGYWTGWDAVEQERVDEWTWQPDGHKTPSSAALSCTAFPSFWYYSTVRHTPSMILLAKLFR